MKRFFGILLALLLVMTLMGCQKATAPTLDTTEPPTTESSSDLSTTLPDERTEEYEHAIVDIENNGGHYSLMTKVTIEYYDGEVVNIFIDEPALLAFQVPEEYTNGVGIVDGNDVLDLTSQIHTYLATNDVDEETKGLLCNIVQWLDDIALLTSAST